MVTIPPALRPQFERAVCHLHALGPRATAEALAEIAGKIGGLPCMLGVLNEYRRLSAAQLRAAGGDRMPPRRLRGVA